MNLQGKIAVVTGASRGIGRAIAISLAKAGASVVVNYQKNAEAAAAVVREIERAAKPSPCKAMSARWPGFAGSSRRSTPNSPSGMAATQFDILVNNAGIGRQGTVETTTEEIFDELMAVNVKGPFFVTQEAISRLRDGGRIINLSSALSRHPYPRMAAYSMGKAAINHFTLILAADWGSAASRSTPSVLA